MTTRTWASFRSVLVTTAVIAVIAPSLVLGDPGALARGKKRGDVFTIEFPIDDCTFVTDDGDAPGGNPFFPLVPGNQIVLENEEDEARIEITTCLDDGSNCSLFDGTPVAGEFMVATGVVTRVVEERESEGGELVEISHNFFARCVENGSVFYFGENVQDIEDGEVTSSGGEWQAGVGASTPGVIMPGLWLLGSRYFQEVAPGIALDRAEHTRMNLDLEFDLVGEGETGLEGCVEIIETSPLDRKGSSSQKMYCPDVGLVFDDGAELVEKNF
jgi:hypothetical protein